MKTTTLSPTTFCLILICAAHSSMALSVEALSEADMGNVMAESGSVLNIMGATASGNSEDSPTADLQLETADDTALASTYYIEPDTLLEPRKADTLSPTDSQPKESISTFKVSERSNGLTGNTTLYYDEKDNLTSSSFQNNALVIKQDVQIQRVQIEQVRHSAGAAVRGDYLFNGIQVNGAVTINQR